MYRAQRFINWRIEAPDTPGDKPKKVPFNIAGNHRIDPLNHANWITYESALMYDPTHVGFVLYEPDQFFCIDLDHAWNGKEWSAQSQTIVAMFPGAYTEVSYSGDGLHIIARGQMPHGYMTRGPGVECYTKDRFIAITGTGAQGNPELDCTAALHAFAPVYLKPQGAPGGVMQGWTTSPVPEATHIEQDVEIIRRLLTSKLSAAAAFGSKASAYDLWYNRAEKLREAFPPDDPKKPYGQSEADAALAAHLAFWTGKDCARMERIMRMSSLVRDKWDRSGDDYLKRTIIGACNVTKRVYNAHPKKDTDGAPQPQGDVTLPTGIVQRVGVQMLDVTAQHEYFDGCCYVSETHKVFTPEGTFEKPESFKAMKGGYEFIIADGKTTKNAFEALTESRVTKFPKAHTTCFRPDRPTGELVTIDGLVAVNTYVPSPVVVGTGDVSRFMDLLHRMFPVDSDRLIIECYLAALRQYPGVKFRWCPLIQGVEGNGKGAITNLAEYMVGPRLTHKPNAKELGDSGGKFTGWIENKLLIIIEEIYVSDRREVLDFIKPLITDNRIEVQHKGAAQKMIDNRANFILTSNHRDAIPKTDNDRRYAIFYTAQQEVADLDRDGMGGDWLNDLFAWLNDGGYADVTGWLQRYQIPDALNPARKLHRAPYTSSTPAAISESMGMVEQEIAQAIQEGRPGFNGGWVSSVHLSKLLHELHRTVPPNKRGAMLKALGYIPHPALTKGQARVTVLRDDGKRPILYVARGSIQCNNITNPSDVVAAYIKAQGWDDVNYKALP